MTEQISKTSANYRGSPNHKLRQQCNRCSMFRLLNKCTLVQGEISPFGWCKFWEPKAKS